MSSGSPGSPVDTLLTKGEAPRGHAPPAVRESLDGPLGIVAGVISFAVYAWSAAPNVTLLDSGEFVVAAQHFGVPHPTGYPLWTFLNWLFLLLPLGNAAWKVAIFSGLCAAGAVGCCAALLSSAQLWCYGTWLGAKAKILSRIVALSFSLMLAFSMSMWSQAVIAEVYALHALLIAIFLMLCYRWLQQPASDRLMLSIFFVLGLSFSNHHLTMTLAPLPYLLILLLRRRAFFDWFFAGVLTVLLGYLAFAILSENPAVLRTAIRFFYCVALAFGTFVWLRRGRLRWRLIAFLPIVVAAGLLPYAYMPLASATNPPMNWGYTRDSAGFFFSINRSQYSGSLSEVSVKSLGRLMGTPQGDPEATRTGAQKQGNRWQTAQLWIGFFWQQLLKAFSVFGLIGYFSSFVLVFALSAAKTHLDLFLARRICARGISPAADRKLENRQCRLVDADAVPYLHKPHFCHALRARDGTAHQQILQGTRLRFLVGPGSCWRSRYLRLQEAKTPRVRRITGLDGCTAMTC